MSDLQDQLMLSQRRIQQRQILAMMGIEQWVQLDSSTINVANMPSVTIDQPVSTTLLIARASVDLKEESTPYAQPATADYDAVHSVSTNISAKQSAVTDKSASGTINGPVTSCSQTIMQTTEVTQIDVPSTVEQLVAPLVASSIEKAPATIKQNSTVNNSTAENNNDHSLSKIAPFDLQGGRYGNWVLMVDIQALSHDSQKLWQNITQALALSCEAASFPICAGMDTVELANASLAGYIFKIGRSEEVLVATLTALPDGLSHPKLVHVPTLNEMLADSTLKRDLWEQLSN